MVVRKYTKVQLNLHEIYYSELTISMKIIKLCYNNPTAIIIMIELVSGIFKAVYVCIRESRTGFILLNILVRKCSTKQLLKII